MLFFRKREKIYKFETANLVLKLNCSQGGQYVYFIYLKDSMNLIGYCDLRIGHNAELYYYGNIGYRVKEQYRGNAFAFEATLFLLDLAKRYNMGYLIVTCSPDNIASKKTIERLGGEYIKTVTVPIWHPLYQTERIKMIYKINLSEC